MLPADILFLPEARTQRAVNHPPQKKRMRLRERLPQQQPALRHRLYKTLIRKRRLLPQKILGFPQPSRRLKYMPDSLRIQLPEHRQNLSADTVSRVVCRCICAVLTPGNT